MAGPPDHRDDVDDGLWPNYDLAIESVATDEAVAAGYAKVRPTGPS